MPSLINITWAYSFITISLLKRNNCMLSNYSSQDWEQRGRWMVNSAFYLCIPAVRGPPEWGSYLLSFLILSHCSASLVTTPAITLWVSWKAIQMWNGSIHLDSMTELSVQVVVPSSMKAFICSFVLIWWLLFLCRFFSGLSFFFFSAFLGSRSVGFLLSVSSAVSTLIILYNWNETNQNKVLIVLDQSFCMQ